MKNNKKRILLATGAVVIAAVAGVNVGLNRNGEAMSDANLANIEALAQEGTGSCGNAAYEYDNDWYEDTKNFRRCGDCMWVQGTRPKYGCN